MPIKARDGTQSVGRSEPSAGGRKTSIVVRFTLFKDKKV